MALHELLNGRLFFRFDRRREPRMFVEKKVIISWGEQARHAGVATVLDWSMRGLRISHELSLTKDDVITVITPGGDLRARVVWNAESMNKCESGLRILDPSDPAFFTRQ